METAPRYIETNFPEPTTDKEYSYSDIKSEAGIYYATTRSNSGYLVSSGLGTVIYVSPFVFCLASESIWEHEKFLKTDYKVTLSFTNSLK